MYIDRCLQTSGEDWFSAFVCLSRYTKILIQQHLVLQWFSQLFSGSLSCMHSWASCFSEAQQLFVSVFFILFCKGQKPTFPKSSIDAQRFIESNMVNALDKIIFLLKYTFYGVYSVDN